MRECITHHYACDCREAKFAHLEAENKVLREAMDDYTGLANDVLRYLERIKNPKQALAGQDKENK